MLGHLLFVIYINGFDEKVCDLLSMFAADRKISGVGDGQDGCLRIPRDMDQLGRRMVGDKIKSRQV